MIANVPPATVRLVDPAWHTGVTVHHQSAGEQRVGIVRQQPLYDLHTVGRIAVFAFRMQTAKTRNTAIISFHFFQRKLSVQVLENIVIF